MLAASPSTTAATETATVLLRPSASYPPMPAGSGPSVSQKPAMSSIQLAQEDDPEATGACIHAVAGVKMCNEITRRWCITGGFASATFFEGATCADLKKTGVY